MAVKNYDKIVRIKIPEIIRSNGGRPDSIELPGTSSKGLEKFKEKIQEETLELINATSTDDIIDEAADVIQVVLDYVRLNGYAAEDLEIVRMAKEIKRGGFLSPQNMSTFLISVIEKE